MAARALSTGTPAVIRSRLTTTAPNPHWRNTWVFAAGRLFSDGNDEACDMVLEVVEDFDNLDRWPGWLLPIGPEHAAAHIDDGHAASTPRWQSRLLDVLLRTLSGHLPRDVQELSIALATVTADTGTLLRVRDALKTALAGSQSCQAVACMLWQQTPIIPSMGAIKEVVLTADQARHRYAHNVSRIVWRDFLAANYFPIKTLALSAPCQLCHRHR